MAIQTRYAGDANGVVNVDSGIGAVGSVIATGLTKNPIPVVVAATNLGVAGEMVTGGAVETILRAIAIDSTIAMYQVDVGQISVYLEATGAGGNGGTQGADITDASDVAAALETRLQALKGGASGAGTGPTGTTTGGNIGIAGNVWADGITVTSNGFKLTA